MRHQITQRSVIETDAALTSADHTACGFSRRTLRGLRQRSPCTQISFQGIAQNLWHRTILFRRRRLKCIAKAGGMASFKAF
jgi:hypothetical protein